MKIGIMSMQRIHNYGSFLQAYGLKKTIESLEHDVCFVDYQFEKKQNNCAFYTYNARSSSTLR